MKTELLEQCNVCDADVIESVDPSCNIARCARCGYVFDNPRPTLEELVRFYSRPAQYDSWLRELPMRQKAWERRLRHMHSTKKPGSLLDLGTGIGQFLDVARKSYDQIYGTEVSSVAVQIARERYGLDLFQGTIESIDWQGRLFDNISLFHVLEHVLDPKAVLRKCHSLLAKNGILVIAVPNEVTSLRARARRWVVRAGMKRRRELGDFGLPAISLGPQSSEVHLSHFTPAVLDRLLRNAGFTVLKRTVDPHYIVTGLPRLRAHVYYYFCLLFMKLCKINLYDTIFVVARKAD